MKAQTLILIIIGDVEELLQTKPKQQHLIELKDSAISEVSEDLQLAMEIR